MFDQDKVAGGSHHARMDSDLDLRRPNFDGVLAWIEGHLDRTLTVEVIARRAGLSPHHFSRLFTARTGRSVMAHVWHLRLVAAARRLTADPALRLVDLALDSGFESQEAFTRSFNRTFGVSPGRLRRAYLYPRLETTMEANDRELAPQSVERLPGLARRDAFAVAGLSHRFDAGTKLAIPGLWRRLVELMPFPGQLGRDTFGVVWNTGRTDGSFLYMVAGRLAPSAATPEGLERKDLPAAAYIVFRITMAGGPVHPQVTAALRTIWSELIPASGLKAIDAPDFEHYGEGLPPDQRDAVIDYHVPVEA
jgi:AraC family transcriptional regulator